MKILLTSKSIIKTNAVTSFFSQIGGGQIEIVDGTTTDFTIPEQPINESTELCALARLNNIKKKLSFEQLAMFDYLISIESGIDTIRCSDFCIAMIEFKGKIFVGRSYDVPIDKKYIVELQKTNKSKSQFDGYHTTIGDIIVKDYPNINIKNWMLSVANVDRKDHIMNALENSFKKFTTTVQFPCSIK